MIPGLLAAIAVFSYLLGGLNGAIIASKYVFHRDVRDYGSGNAGLTNFYRTFGAPGLAIVIGTDVLKTVIAVVAGGLIMGTQGAASTGQVFAGFCVMLGHIYPVFYGFRGGKGVLCAEGEGGCLGCAAVCETCASVCPNRANVAIRVPGKRQRQILHMDGMCHECGNCGVFCPYDSRPYKDKFTLFWNRADFENSTNAGYLPLEGSRVLVRLGSVVREYDAADPACGLYEDLRQLILTVAKDYPYLLRH